MKRSIICCSLFLLSQSLAAQVPKPAVPKGTPGKVPLPTPRIQPLKPDLIFVSATVIGVVEVPSRHLFETTVSITLRNQGAGVVPTGFTLDLRSRYGTRAGGWDYSQIGANAGIRGPMAAGETRTVEYVFAKDITAMGRARLECMIRIDNNNNIAESDENNNSSGFFYITPPRE